MSYLSKKGYVIKKESLSKEELIDLKHTLTARPLVDSKFNFKVTESFNYPIFIETKNKIYIPKMYGINKFGYPNNILDNYNGISWQNDIPFNGNLYDRQLEPANVLINACKEQGGGILALATGYGKTICLLYVLSQLKGKTIIVVNKIPLMNQWISEIKTFLPNAKVGVIQGQKNIDIQDKDIVVAMLQSLARIDYPECFFDDYKIAVFDEIHNISSQMFSKVLFNLCSKYTIGLSATPNRSDGCEYVFKYHIGEIVYKGETERKGKPPILKLIKIDSKEYKEISTENKFTGQKQIQFTSMLSELIDMPKRNSLIIELIKQHVVQNRKILVLSDRRNHLVLLKNLLDKEKVTFTYGLFLGAMKQIDLDKARTANVILATFAAFKEGVSEKDLDTLILCSPKKYIGHIKNSIKNEGGLMNQVVGRIFRRDHIERNPVIIDLSDQFSVYKNQAAQRRVFYKEHFKNGIFEEHYINLDEHNEKIKIENIQIKKPKQLKKNEELENINNNNESILQYCIIDD